MSAEAVIGYPFTFQTLFVDVTNVPVAVADATITIYRFSIAGSKVTLVNAAPVPAAAPAEVGRYAYTYTVPASLTDGDVLYADMTATAPDTSHLRFQMTITAISVNRGLGPAGGLTARFVV